MITLIVGVGVILYVYQYFVKKDLQAAYRIADWCKDFVLTILRIEAICLGIFLLFTVVFVIL